MHLPPGVLKISPPAAGQNAGVGLTGLLGRDHVSSCQFVPPRRDRHHRADIGRKWMRKLALEW